MPREGLINFHSPSFRRKPESTFRLCISNLDPGFRRDDEQNQSFPRLRVLSGKEVCAILVLHGFTEVRRRGSHVVMQRREGSGTRTVPVPDHAELRTGTLLSIIRQSGLPRTEFES